MYWMKGNLERFFKGVSVLVAVVFLFSYSGPVCASKNMPLEKEASVDMSLLGSLDIVIPHQYGTIMESFKGDSGKVIVHIQDLHANKEAQLSSGKLLEGLFRKHGLDFVGVEGAKGKIDLTVPMNFPQNDQLRKKLADMFLDSGELTGEEYITITESLPFTIWGIEDRNLYLENLNCYKGSLKYSDETGVYLADIKKVLDSLVTKIYSPVLKELDEKNCLYQESQLPLNEYALYLNEKAHEISHGLVNRFSNFETFIEAVELENNSDPKKVDSQIRTLVAEITDIFSRSKEKTKLEKLVKESLSFRLGEVSANTYYFSLKTLAEENGVDVNKYEYFTNYLQYLAVVAEIDDRLLFSEIDTLTDSLQKRIIQTEDEKQLAAILKNFRLLRKFVALMMTDSDFQCYLDNRDIFNFSSFVTALNKIAGRYGVSKYIEFDEITDKNLVLLEGFYEAAHKRNVAMVENLLGQMDTNAKNKAVMIAGGFHTRGVTDILRDKGVSYIVIAPKVTGEIDSDKYRFLLSGNSRPMGQLLIQLNEQSMRQRDRFDKGLGSGNSGDARWIHAAVIGIAMDMMKPDAPWSPLAVTVNTALAVYERVRTEMEQMGIAEHLLGLKEVGEGVFIFGYSDGKGEPGYFLIDGKNKKTSIETSPGIYEEAKDISAIETIKKIDEVISRLRDSRDDAGQRSSVLEEINAMCPGLDKFMDVFHITKDPNQPLNDPQIAALRSRLIKALSPSDAKKRVAVLGYNQNALSIIRGIVSKYTDQLELVTFVGQPAPKVAEWIKYNSQLGKFDKVAWDLAFLYLGDQASAISVYNHSLTEASSALDFMPWTELAVDVVVVDEDQAEWISSDVFQKLEAMGIEVIVCRTPITGYKLEVPGFRGTERRKAINLASAESVAYTAGVSTLQELGNILVCGADVVEKYDYGAQQPSYRIPGVYQLQHRISERHFSGEAEDLGLKKDQIVPTHIFNAPLERGKLVRITAVLDTKVSREEIIALFRNKAEGSNVFDIPEWWAKLSASLVFGNSRVLFDPHQVYVNPNDAGTQVSISFFVDEAVVDPENVLQAIVEEPAKGEEPAFVQAIEARPYSPSEIFAELSRLERSKLTRRNVPRLAKKYKRKIDAVGAKQRCRALVHSDEIRPMVRIQNIKTTNTLLFSGSFIKEKGVFILLDENRKPIAFVGVENNGDITATSLLIPPSLEDVQPTLERYYKCLRKFAYETSKTMKRPIAVHDIYEHGEGLRVTFKVDYRDYDNSTGMFSKMQYVSLDLYSYKESQWDSISKPDYELIPSAPDQYNIAINAPGGRMGSLTTREASKRKNLRIVAVSGPDAERLAKLVGQRDYIQGAYKGTVSYDKDWLELVPEQKAGEPGLSEEELKRKKFPVFRHRVFRSPENLPWGSFMFAGIPIHVALDSTGKFNNVDGVNRHRRAGARRGMLAAPGKGDPFETATFVKHVNDDKYNPNVNFFVSPASCTTGCLSTVNRLIELAVYYNRHKGEEITMEGFLAEAKSIMLQAIAPTIHSLTGELFGPDTIDPIAFGKDLRRGVSAVSNIYGTSSGAGKNTVLVDAATIGIPSYAIRTPHATGSLVLPTYVLKGRYSMDDVAEAVKFMQKAFRTPEGDARFAFVEGIDRSSEILLLRELADVMATIPSDKMQIVNFKNKDGEDMTLIKVPAWYENEWYPSLMYVDMMEHMMGAREHEYEEAQAVREAEEDETSEPFVSPYSTKLALSDLPDEAFRGKYWFVRVDHNVVSPLWDASDQKMVPFLTDRHRIVASADDIEYLVKRGARVIVATHNGRKKTFGYLQKDDGEVVERFSVKIAGEELSRILRKRNVLAASDFRIAPAVTGTSVSSMAQDLRNGQVLYLENLRFYEGEEAGDIYFAREIYDTLFGHLSPSEQVSVGYANIAFGAAHRGKHGSMAPLMQLIQGPRVLGLLQDRELRALDSVLEDPPKPVVAFVSGVKISEKLPAVEAMIRRGVIDVLVTASPAFMVAMGNVPGISLPGDDIVAQENEVAAAYRLLELARERGVKVIIPKDVVAAFAFPNVTDPKSKVKAEIARVDEIPEGTYILDIAATDNEGNETETIKEIREVLRTAGTVIWNGTMGLVEVEQFRSGTDTVIKLINSCGAKKKLVVGGDGVAAVNRCLRMDKAAKRFTLCTGGGAALLYLATQNLTALDPLHEKSELLEVLTPRAVKTGAETAEEVAERAI